MNNLHSFLFFVFERFPYVDCFAWLRSSGQECYGDACVGAAALGMASLKTERIWGGALCMSCSEIMILAVWLLHLQLMEPAMEGSWAIFS